MLTSIQCISWFFSATKSLHEHGLSACCAAKRDARTLYTFLLDSWAWAWNSSLNPSLGSLPQRCSGYMNNARNTMHPLGLLSVLQCPLALLLTGMTRTPAVWLLQVNCTSWWSWRIIHDVKGLHLISYQYNMPYAVHSSASTGSFMPRSVARWLVRRSWIKMAMALWLSFICHINHIHMNIWILNI